MPGALTSHVSFNRKNAHLLASSFLNQVRIWDLRKVSLFMPAVLLFVRLSTARSMGIAVLNCLARWGVGMPRFPLLLALYASPSFCNSSASTREVDPDSPHRKLSRRVCVAAPLPVTPIVSVAPCHATSCPYYCRCKSRYSRFPPIYRKTR